MNRPRSFSPLRRELELAVRDRLAPVEGGRLPFPGAPVPDDHVAGAVLPRGDDAFEVEVLDRVVLDVDGHPPDGRVERRALGDRPRHQDAVDFEPEVVVQARRPVALDDEATGPRGARAVAFIGVPGVAGGLGRPGEVALAVIVLQRHAISVPKTARSGKGSAPA